jgi:threonine dehydrogenase-like Zn-dependent dehydrogenase
VKGIYYNGTEAVYRTDLPLPARGKGESLLKIIYAAVCSTDREILKGYRPSFRGIMGHEFVAVVVDSDDMSLIGKRVVGEINENCGECIYCRTGRPHHCSFRRTPGLSRDGCFAEYMVLRTELLHIVPDSLPSEMAVFTEPLAAAFEITTQIRMEKGTEVGIIGDGRLALCIANVMHLMGADLTVVGRHEEKLSLFRTLGKVTSSVPSEAFEVVVEASGNPSGFQSALKAVRKKGTIVLKSTYAEKVTLDLSLIPVNELTLIGSRCGPFEPALEALGEGKIVLPPLEKYPLSQFREAFASSAFKAGFEL